MLVWLSEDTSVGANPLCVNRDSTSGRGKSNLKRQNIYSVQIVDSGVEVSCLGDVSIFLVIMWIFTKYWNVLEKNEGDKEALLSEGLCFVGHLKVPDKYGNKEKYFLRQQRLSIC